MQSFCRAVNTNTLDHTVTFEIRGMRYEYFLSVHSDTCAHEMRRLRKAPGKQLAWVKKNSFKVVKERDSDGS